MEQMFEHYKKYNNLNAYRNYDDQESMKTIDNCEKFFFDRINESLKKQKQNEEQENKSKIEIISGEEMNINILNLKAYTPTKNKARKQTENLFKPSDNHPSICNIREKQQKFFNNKDCLDLDDQVVEVTLPDEYNYESHEELMKNLASKLMRSRELFKGGSGINKEAYKRNLMESEDFSLLICLLRKKKEAVYEKNPYSLEERFKMDDVYINEQDIDFDNNDDIDKVCSFIRS